MHVVHLEYIMLHKRTKDIVFIPLAKGGYVLVALVCLCLSARLSVCFYTTLLKKV